MFCKFHRKRNKKGFTLVEVIVVAVIVAVLAAVAIPLYLGYVQRARIQAAENAAGGLASFLAAVRNSENAANYTLVNSLAAGASTSFNPGAGVPNVSYSAPKGITLAITGSVSAGGTVQATTIDNKTSQNYNW
jgi:prepilin-type N-terminal cleavage/methylation domain-containing protein